MAVKYLLTAPAGRTDGLKEVVGEHSAGDIHFPTAICRQFGSTSSPLASISLVFLLAVNLIPVWIALPLAAVLSRRHPAVGLTGAGLAFANGVTHVAAGFVGGYNSGLVTAAVIFLPLAIWSTIAFFGDGKLLRSTPRIPSRPFGLSPETPPSRDLPFDQHVPTGHC